MLKRAVAHHRAGETNKAERLYERILRDDPCQADALNLLGVIALTKGRSDRATSLIQKARALRPREPSILSNLGNALKSAGRFEEAGRAYRDALDSDPRFPAALTNLGLLLNETGKSKEAIGYFQGALAINARLFEAYQGLGDAFRIVGRTDDAEGAYRHALQIRPDLASAATALAAMLGNQDRFAEAYVLHEKAIHLQPEVAGHRLALARTAYHEGDVDRAVLTFRHSLKLDPTSASSWNELGRALRAIGDLDEAKQCFLQALTLDADLVDAHRNLALAGNNQGEVVLRSFLSTPSIALEDQVLAGFALGKMLDETGKFDEAFAAYNKANVLHRTINAEAGRFFDPEKFHDLVKENLTMRTSYSDVDAIQTELPVYIVGMPRSGTTLVEQIIASHPAVFGGGELRHTRRLTQILAGGFSTGAIGREIEAVMARLQHLGGAALRVTDKMPDNLFHLRAIQSCFPNARVIFCRRHPLDTCLSCYFQLFTSGNLFSYDLKDCGSRFQGTDHIMTHWMATTSLRWIAVDYEDLVTNVEQESRRLIAFLGLTWNAACLDFHKTRRAVQTASGWQVRQRLFTSSIGRWKSYDAHLRAIKNLTSDTV